MSLIANERTKLLATFLNNTAVGCLTAGVITTMGSLVLDLSGVRQQSVLVVLVCIIWLLLGLNLHLAGQLILGRLQDETS